MMENWSFRRRKYQIFSRSNQMSLAEQITDIARYVRTYFWVTILNEDHVFYLLLQNISLFMLLNHTCTIFLRLMYGLKFCHRQKPYG